VTYWPFWLCAATLAAVPLLHWAFLQRAVAVSGRYTALVDRWRRGRREAEPVPEMSEAEAIALVQAMTAEAFGDAAIESEPAAPAPTNQPVFRAADGPAVHGTFLVGLVVGGLLSAVLGEAGRPAFALRSTLFSHYFGTSSLSTLAVLFVGGVLVGAGTRMSGGCTSGHGLCGVSQLQKGSLLATASFFGAGALTSFLLRAFA
jgi:uncharacterized protein